MGIRQHGSPFFIVPGALAGSWIRSRAASNTTNTVPQYCDSDLDTFWLLPKFSSYWVAKFGTHSLSKTILGQLRRYNLPHPALLLCSQRPPAVWTAPRRHPKCPCPIYLDCSAQHSHGWRWTKGGPLGSLERTPIIHPVSSVKNGHKVLSASAFKICL